MSKMKECLINSVRVSLINQERIVVLKEKDDELYLPIWIGLYEFESITIALQKIEVARPLTHDLMKTILSVLDGTLICIEITALESDTYYANLVVEQGGAQKRIDCRPSDALALVVRSGVPIYVNEDVLDRAGIRPEENTPSETAELSEDEINTPDLSVFEDFLGKLGEDDSDQETDQPGEDNPDQVF
ncbi:MAG: bifunctional nuclease family protein [Anaerolineaceae bacterium]